MNETLYIGVDVAKSRLDFDLPGLAEVANTAEAIKKALGVLSEGAHLVCESTGGYEAGLVAAALAAGVPVSVAAPQRALVQDRQDRCRATERVRADPPVKAAPGA